LAEQIDFLGQYMWLFLFQFRLEQGGRQRALRSNHYQSDSSNTRGVETCAGSSNSLIQSPVTMTFREM